MKSTRGGRGENLLGDGGDVEHHGLHGGRLEGGAGEVGRALG